jgi:hypothetical protein
MSNTPGSLADVGYCTKYCVNRLWLTCCHVMMLIYSLFESIATAEVGTIIMFMNTTVCFLSVQARFHQTD